MIDNWFKKDLEIIFSDHPIAVFVDESKESEFLLNELASFYSIQKVQNELEELYAKYLIEKNVNKALKFLIYTNTPKDQLKFIREYCETNGCIEIKYLEHYIKKKVNQHLNLNINLPKEELISAAKISIGKDQTYWMDLSHKGSSEIFDLEKELLPFLDDPLALVKKYDQSTRELFFKKISELIGQTYIEKPPKTLAADVVNHLLDGLYNNNPNQTLLRVYYNWLDSMSSQRSFKNYLDKYKPKSQRDIFNIHPAHPFISIDELWLKDLGENLYDQHYVINFLPKINERISNKAAKNIGIEFWTYIKVLLEFDEKNINQLASLSECISFYTQHFYKLDNAIRKLYTRYLNQKPIIRPLQDYYKNLISLFLDKWFKYIDEYKSDQTGLIQKIIEKNSGKTAIIIGDGISYEFSKDILSRVSKQYRVTDVNNFVLAGLPTETENNMSQLYVDSGMVLSTKQEREKYLSSINNSKSMAFIDLENINELHVNENILICSCKDPDKLGETYQQKALKYFDSIADLYAGKIEQLFKNGYRDVFLVTDHGFVLTGILENSDKIDVNFKQKIHKSERYIRTVDSQHIDTNLLMEKPLKYNEFNYCYFAKRLGPFKTPGVYGYSHGGISPQEAIIPYLHWSNNKAQNEMLQVSIANKNELKEVTGDFYAVKLKSKASTNSIFESERKVLLLFFENNKKVNESDIITILRDEEIKKEYQFGSHHLIELIVLDALTKEQLDKVTIKKSSARDLGGLL